MEHTPIPWTSDGTDIYAGGLIVAQASFRLDQWEANAAFIVRAVNNHAKLLEALEQAVLFIEGVFPEPSPLLKQDLAFYQAAIEEAKK